MITAAGQRKHAIPSPSVSGLRIDDRIFMRVGGAGSPQPRDRLLNDLRLTPRPHRSPEAVHRDDYEEIEDAFRSMAIRTAVALCNLLKLWKARN